jgi:hypothetical protein
MKQRNKLFLPTPILPCEAVTKTCEWCFYQKKTADPNQWSQPFS